MHCHMAPHITPYPERPDTLREHDAHDVARHALDGMAGLVLGITSTPRPGAATSAPPPRPTRSVRLLVQEHGTGAGRRFGYIVQHGAEPRRDSVAVPGLPLVLQRGETVSVTVVNRTSELTTVHWHGIELESIYDGVAGWSGAQSNLAPLIARGDSFTVTFTPPRAGTYIHHTHMDESGQLTSGMYAPLIVLERGERFDPARDLLFVVGGVPAAEGFAEALNGHTDPPDLLLDAGGQYRLRFINILPAMAVEASLLAADSAAMEWRPVSKDGATLPASRQRPRRAHVPRIGVGETYDFEWTPAAGTYELVLSIPRIEKALRQTIVVRR
jgi:manganese oxidase